MHGLPHLLSWASAGTRLSYFLIFKPGQLGKATWSLINEKESLIKETFHALIFFPLPFPLLPPPCHLHQEFLQATVKDWNHLHFTILTMFAPLLNLFICIWKGFGTGCKHFDGIYDRDKGGFTFWSRGQATEKAIIKLVANGIEVAFWNHGLDCWEQEGSEQRERLRERKAGNLLLFGGG